jgi:hypothetical protein
MSQVCDLTGYPHYIARMPFNFSWTVRLYARRLVNISHGNFNEDESFVSPFSSVKLVDFTYLTRAFEILFNLPLEI